MSNEIFSCAGDQEDTETPGDNQAAWFEHVASLRQRKHEKMREYHAIMQSCMRESVMMGDEPVGDSQIPAESTVKPKRGKKQKGQSSSESLESSSSEEHFRQ